MSRLFLDSNVLIEGLSTDWGVSKGVLILCYWRVHEMILAEAVKDEVEHAAFAGHA